MSSRVQLANWSIRRFPRKDAWAIILLLWVAAVLVVLGDRYVMPVPAYADSWASAVDRTIPPARAIAFATGVWLIGYYLRLYVAHGWTRRDFMRRATVFLGLTSAALAVLTTLGFALERVAYWDAVEWPAIQTEYFVIESATDLPGIFALLWLKFSMWMVTGMLVASGFRRFKVAGLLLTIPLALTMIVLTENGMGSAYILDSSYQVQHIALWLSVPSVLLGLATTWALTRKIAI